MNNENDETRGSNSRRDFLKKVGGAGLAGLAAPLLPGIAKAGQPEPAGSISVIKHVVFQIQENHSYDQYFGKYTGNPSGIGIPAGYKCSGDAPFKETSLTDSYDPNHDWSAIHTGWANGAMTGWVSANSKSAMGYYTSKQLSYYYSLLPEFTLCGAYHCSMLTETQPNRFCGFAGTSGGNCADSVPNNYFKSSSFPIIFDLLKEAGITFKNYNLNESSDYTYAACWSNWATGGPNNELNATYADFTSDCANDTLPQVVYLTNNYQEHPGDGSISQGMDQMKSFIGTLMASKAWASTAIFLTYDEGGGFFDHVKPPVCSGLTASDFGSLGVRVPCLVISPYAIKNNVDTTSSEHTSVLKFIEKLFGLPTLYSVNKSFNSSTPTASVLSNPTGGAPFPPRDNPAWDSIISDMTQCFNFAAAPNLYPDVPGTPWYSKQTERRTTVAYSFGR